MKSLSGENGEFLLASDEFLQREIASLKALEQRCVVSRRRFSNYDLLAAVLALYGRLKRNGKATRCTRRIVELESCGSKSSHPIRIIIDACSRADGKTKSRCFRALRYCWRERRRWTNLQDFLRENGGPAGCASKFAERNPKSPRNYVRVGGEGRVPKIPFFVSRSMVDRHGFVKWTV